MFNTSSIRSAATPALGSITEIIVIMRNAMTICIVYVINAIMSPTCICPRSIPFAPIQTMRTVIAFIISIMAGIIIDITRFVKSCVDMRSLFALSNLSSSCFSLLNALITIVPVSISRDTRFTRSTRLCIFLNLGIATTMSTSTSESTAPTATPIIQPIPVLVPVTFMIPPIPMIGA